MDKELEALERLAMPDEMHIEECKKLGIDPTEDYDFLKQALLELKAIKESNPSEALEIIRKCESSNFLNFWFPKFVEDLKIVENYILKAQEQEKIFDDNLVFENGHFMSGFSYKGKQIVAMPLEEYNKFVEQEKENKFLSDTIATINQQYTDLMLEYQEQKRVLKIIKEKNVNLEVLGISNDVNCYNKVIGRYSVCCKELTEEEFDLLKKWPKGE